MRQLFAAITALTIGFFALPNAEDSLFQPFRFQGRVSNGTSPIAGATVVLLLGESILGGTATDSGGRFEIAGRVNYDQPLLLCVRAIGFAAGRINVTAGPLVSLPEILLSNDPLDVGAITVLGTPEVSPMSNQTSHTELVQRARQSFVSTNPIAAIQSPEVVRQGSNHSSRIRIDGAAPRFLVDGASIGTDPDHYGMFAVLPAPAVEEIELQSRGTSARHASPSVVNFETPRAYGKPLSGEINLSLIEATGAIAYGTVDRYACATVRKSVLDQLVNNIDVRAGRRTIPPAGFTDLFLTVGKKSRGGREVIVNQYHVGDRLIFDAGPSKIAPNGLSTFQETEEHFVSGHYRGLYGGALIDIMTGVHLRDEKYAASSLSEPSSLDIDLKEQVAEAHGAINAAWDWRGHAFDAGVESRAVIGRNTSLTQKNWNFLPPNAASDNPHPYQNELNQYFGSLDFVQSNLEHAGYLSVRHHHGQLTFENGVRAQAFTGLAQVSDFTHRHRATFAFSANASLTAFAGTFSESPISRVLDPYQVLVRLDQHQLIPVRTDLLTIGGRFKAFSVCTFARQSHNLPFLEPDFSSLHMLGAPSQTDFDTFYLRSDRLLSMKSTGEATHYGAEIGLSTVSLFDPRITLNAHYTFTRARHITPAASYPADLDSPHRLHIQGSFAASRQVTLGAEFGLRTGYPYTPYPSDRMTYDEQRYNTAYYSQQQSLVNSERFPINFQLNVSMTYDFGRSQLFLSVANLTNRGNPIINTNNGFVYDAGILPNLGYRLSF